MHNFEREFGKNAISYLSLTFRSNQGISDAAKAFIERNLDQLKRRVVSSDGTAENCIRIIRYSSDDDYRAKYEAIARDSPEVASRPEQAPASPVVPPTRQRSDAADGATVETTPSSVRSIASVFPFAVTAAPSDGRSWMSSAVASAAFAFARAGAQADATSDAICAADGVTGRATA